MIEEITRSGKDELAKEVQSLNELSKKSFKEIIDEKIKLDSDFKLKDLTDKEKLGLSKEDIESYEIGKKLFEDKKKDINPLEIIPDYLLDDADKEVKYNVRHGRLSPEQLYEFKEILRQQYIMLAFSIYNKINQDHFSEEVEKLGKETLPDDVVKYYFDTMCNAYCFNSEDLTVSYEEGKEDTLKKNKAFASTITMSKMLALSTNELFLNRLTKQCNDYRFKKHVENLNYIFSKKLKTSEKSSIATVDQLEYLIRRTFFNKFKINIHELNKRNNGAIGKAYIIAMDELAKTTFSDKETFTEIYFYNVNMNMIAQSTNYINLSGAAKLVYENILEFITNIYNYYLDKK